ncbi:MAG TPA: 2-amino-4-hydroxy-6-hydroxymethyldihydropteridine diphosphokinase [Stellaceae bacterium]|nr:2-amino-4-hydroxy-6-hydroxymethyldihydropteridine diphosphokinase [Stellaceae bacterium]
MILIGLGANLPSAAGPPRATIEAALAALAEEGVRVLARSRFYRTAPVPRSDQPDYVNAASRIESRLDPAALLALLHRIEARFGRVRGAPNAARALDLDLLAFHDLVMEDPGGPIVPHPRLHLRAFVLLPLAEIAPDWRHPMLRRTVAELIAALSPGQDATPM